MTTPRHWPSSFSALGVPDYSGSLLGLQHDRTKLADQADGAGSNGNARDGARRRISEPVDAEGSVTLAQLLPGAMPSERRASQHILARLRARAFRIQPGSFDMAELKPGERGWAALLVLDGLLLAELGAGRARVGWLLGAEDLVCPWEVDVGLTRSTTWCALVPTQVALLDNEFVRRAAPVPGVMSELLLRSHRTSHWLLAKSLLVSSPSVEERLMLMFALLGERWGRMTSEGVHVGLKLTHSLIASLVGARRPTVTATLRSLHEKGIVTRDVRGGWLLRPGNVVARPACWQVYADVLGCW